MKKFNCPKCNQYGAYESSHYKGVLVHKCSNILEEVGSVNGDNLILNDFIKINDCFSYSKCKSLKSIDNEVKKGFIEDLLSIPDDLDFKYILLKYQNNVKYLIAIKNDELYDICFPSTPRLFDYQKMAIVHFDSDLTKALKEIFKHNLLKENKISYDYGITDTPF